MTKEENKVIATGCCALQEKGQGCRGGGRRGDGLTYHEEV